MFFLRKKFEESPVYARVAPFVVFLALTLCQTSFGHTAPFWFYFLKTLVGAWLVWEMRPFVTEMRWALSWEAVVVGVGVCVLWIGLDPFYPHLGQPSAPWNPHLAFGSSSALAWMFVLARLLGSTFVVPPLEEVIYRSFLYRYLVRTDFLSLPFRQFHLLSFVVTAVLFGFGHHEWLAGILCGMIYQGLVLRKNRLGDAMTAHAITNFLLGLWVISRGAWHFW